MIFFKKIALFICFFSFFYCFSQKKSNYYHFKSKKEQKAPFLLGEKTKYKFSYGKSNKKGFLTAGYGQFEVKNITKIGERDCFYIKASGGSTKLFSVFYEVNDTFETYLDSSNLISLKFIRNVHEDNYNAKQQVSFFRKSNYAKSKNLKTGAEKKMKISKHTQDMLSALFASRSIPNENIILNDTVFLEIYNLEKDKIFPTYFIPIKKETIDTEIGNLQTIKCKIHTEKSRIFPEKSSTYIWVTDDSKHLPVKLETPIKVGSIYIEILSVENLYKN
tara:strand:- start:512 stop:1339 length:828 start_codon:yes stop_codon:yes gene_type:complete